MIKSMTGYGRSQQTLDGREILVEIKSVNHRYFEFSARVPRAYGYLEEKLKTFLQGKVSRGKVEVGVTVYNIEGKDALIEVNSSIAKGYVDALRKANETLELKDDITLSNLIRLPDIFNVIKNTEDEEVIWNDVKTAAEEALSNFVAMRETEGLKMREDVEQRLDYIESLVEKVEERSPMVTEAYRERLFGKLTEVLNDKKIDEQRILTEAAIFSEKTAVDEETVRLKSHINQFRGLLEINEPVGRKLDFLIQEFNRESNTIGSKAQDVEITKIVVELKSEIEKIREQIQNIE
ncbi:MAG: YicC family protein [Ruminococcus sp.]|nr:YicC family protein [Ruminococcus sp.]MCM1381642.1 YicC family protein [Muribaculaceae bacterium]